ncbi:MAG: hypothetical protein CMH57_10150 [Myxococcales bacterium]|nr:hypothetical protein [Myxococcales bacterium]
MLATPLRRALALLITLGLTLALSACQDTGATRADKTPTQPTSAPADKPTSAPAEKPAAGSKETPPATDAASAFDHAAWDALLKKYVTEEGPVRYKDWKASADDMKALKAYTASIASADLSKLSKKQQLAFYINAYNAYTILAVLERYPIESVMKVDGFFKKINHQVAGEQMTLDTLENTKIREGFGEARIHFVVNCASASCPKLRRDAITPANMEAEMEAAAREYIQKETRVEGGAVSTSEIFKWFKGDFDKAAGSVGEFLAKRLDGEAATLAKAGKIKYHPYGWDLNEAR